MKTTAAIVMLFLLSSPVMAGQALFVGVASDSECCSETGNLGINLSAKKIVGPVGFDGLMFFDRHLTTALSFTLTEGDTTFGVGVINERVNAGVDVGGVEIQTSQAEWGPTMFVQHDHGPYYLRLAYTRTEFDLSAERSVEVTPVSAYHEEAPAQPEYEIVRGSRHIKNDRVWLMIGYYF